MPSPPTDKLTWENADFFQLPSKVKIFSFFDQNLLKVSLSISKAVRQVGSFHELKFLKKRCSKSIKSFPKACSSITTANILNWVIFFCSKSGNLTKSPFEIVWQWNKEMGDAFKNVSIGVEIQGCTYCIIN